MVLLLLLQSISSALTILITSITLIVFRLAAALVIILIQAIRVPGLAIECALDSFASLLRTASEHALELAWDGLTSLISNAFDLLCGAAAGSAGLTASAVVELVEQAKIAGEGLAELFPEVFEGLSGTLGEMAKAFWSNYVESYWSSV